jgi:mitogen-activated protein kinase organizer 1
MIPNKPLFVIKDQENIAPVNCVRFTSNGSYCMSAGQDKLIKLYNTDTGKRITSFNGHSRDIHALKM